MMNFRQIAAKVILETNVGYITKEYQQQLGSDFFYTHMSLCTLCSWTMLCYRNHHVPWHGQHNLASLPAALCHCPTPQEPFLMSLRSALFLVTAHSAEADVMTWTAQLNYRKETQFISCCSMTKGKTARDIALFPFPEGEAFVSDRQWGTDTKSPCCHCRVWPGCTAWISIMRMLHWTLRSSFCLPN